MIPWSQAPASYRRLGERVGAALDRSVRTSAVYYEGRIKRRLSGEVLRYRSGALRRSVTVKVIARQDDLVIRGSAGGGPERVAYAAIHEFGGMIFPRARRFLGQRSGRPYLAVPVPGGIRLVRQVRIPSRPYMRPSAVETIDVLKRAVASEFADL